MAAGTAPGRRRAVIGVALAVGLGVAGWSGWRAWGSNGGDAVPVLGVDRGVAVAVRGTGSVEADRVARVAFEAVGTIARIRARVGDRVAAGQELAALDDRLQAARVASARAAVAEAEAQVRVRQAAVDGATAVLERRRKTEARTVSLRVAGHAAVTSVEDSELGVASALADLHGAANSLELARAQVDSARAALRVAEIELDRHTLRAPFDGLVIDRSQQVGEVADGRSPLMTVLDTSSVWVRAYMGEDLAGALAVGQEAEVVLRSRMDRPLKGRLVRIDREADRATEDRRFFVAFDAMPEGLALGEPAEVRVVTGTVAGAVLIPERLIRDLRGGAGTVWLRDGDSAAERRVRLGRRLDDGRWELAEALPPGAAVLADLPRGWFGSPP